MWMDRYDESDDLADLRQSRDLDAEAFEAAQDDFYTGAALYLNRRRGP
jgi:hypothetical protein